PLGLMQANSGMKFMLNLSVGEINDRLVRLGTRHSVIYLAKGDRYMLIGAGGQWVLPALEQQIQDFDIDMDRVRYLLIGHSHYDHCGTVPYLQKRYPHLKVLASRRATELYAKEKAVSNMRKFSRQAMETMGAPAQLNGISLEFDGIRVARALQEGERVDLGNNLSFDVFETPGHSRCSMMVYAAEQKWLFCSDSMPIPAPVGNGYRFMCTASESFVTYLASLKKLEKLPIQLCAWEHYGYMTGDEARRIISDATNMTLEYKRLLRKRVEQSDNMETIVRWAAQDWLDATGFKFLSFEVMLHITRTMIKNAVAEQEK
ncbi:MAG: MBL fold metallo-hydrolase, partial [Desulfobacterales bacterium]|nr:MBL fold metallo-hydrolase [Desulfobacterales bacterium]